MGSRIVVSCPCCGATQPLDVLRVRRVSHELDARTHTVVSHGRGRIANWFAPLEGADLAAVHAEVEALLLAAAEAWDLADAWKAKVARAERQGAELARKAARLQGELWAAMQASAERTGEPLTRQRGRRHKVRGAKVRDGGNRRVALLLPGSVRVDNARVLDAGKREVSL